MHNEVIDNARRRKNLRGVNERAEADRKIQVRAVASFVLILAILVVTVLGIIFLVINKRVAKEEVKQRASRRSRWSRSRRRITR